jgi:hypothetical protein
MNNTPQGETIEGNAADTILMVNQGDPLIHHLKKETPRCA